MSTVTVTVYKEQTDDVSTWRSPRPDFDLDKFNKELKRRGGETHGLPRYRCIWGGTDPRYLIEECDEMVGYKYHHEQEWKWVSCNDLDFEFPDGVIPVPDFKTHQAFIPRFIIEELVLGMGYSFIWAVDESESARVTDGGVVEITSAYREPSELDLQRIEKYNALKESLSADDIRNGVDRQKERVARAKADDKAAFIDDFAHDFARLMTDGVPNATKFGFDPKLRSFNIGEHSRNLLKEYNENNE